MRHAHHGTHPSPESRAKIPVAAARASLPPVISPDGASSPMGVSPAARVPGKCILVNVHRFQAGVPRTHVRRSTRVRAWRPRPSGSRCASRARPVRAQVGGSRRGVPSPGAWLRPYRGTGPTVTPRAQEDGYVRIAPAPITTASALGARVGSLGARVGHDA